MFLNTFFVGTFETHMRLKHWCCKIVLTARDLYKKNSLFQKLLQPLSSCFNKVIGASHMKRNFPWQCRNRPTRKKGGTRDQKSQEADGYQAMVIGYSPDEGDMQRVPWEGRKV